MPIPALLDLPIFDAAHRSLATDQQNWCDRNLSAQPTHGDNDSNIRDLVSALGRSGSLGPTVALEYGGARAKLDVRSLCISREILAFHSGLADFCFAMQGLGSGPISLFGSSQQKLDYLPAVRKGEKIAAFALSELEAGSDVASIACRATQREDCFELNGTKSWISNAGIADFYIVFARSGPGDGAKGLSALIVNTDTPGLRVTERPEITSPHPVGTLEFTNCRVPHSNLIGTIGLGFSIAMATLDVFRSTVGAAALGLARRALFETLNHITVRQTFGKKLCDHQITQARVAEMTTELDAAELLVYRAAWQKDNGAERVTREAAMAKLFATETAQKVIDSAIQLLGARGVVRDSILERLYRDIRPLRIYEGTSEIQKIIIATQVVRDFCAEQGDK